MTQTTAWKYKPPCIVSSQGTIQRMHHSSSCGCCMYRNRRIGHNPILMHFFSFQTTAFSHCSPLLPKRMIVKQIEIIWSGLWLQWSSALLVKPVFCPPKFKNFGLVTEINKQNKNGKHSKPEPTLWIIFLFYFLFWGSLGCTNVALLSLLQPIRFSCLVREQAFSLTLSTLFSQVKLLFIYRTSGKGT